MKDKSKCKEDLVSRSFYWCAQVQVSDVHAYGEAAVNITVKEPKRINTPPFAVISPKHQEITLPHDNTILDAAGRCRKLGWCFLCFHLIISANVYGIWLKNVTA